MPAPLTGDWLGSIAGDDGEELRATLAPLELSRLQRYPIPKSEGFAIGREPEVLRRFLTGGNAVLLGSVASSAYRAAASAEIRRLFDGFVLNRALPRATWSQLLGEAKVARWVEQGVLQIEPPDLLACRFQVIPVYGLVLLTDSTRGAYALPAGANPISPVENVVNDHLVPRLQRGGGRALEVGPGAGLTTMLLARGHESCDAVDINPRAVQATRFNLRLNGVDNCRVHHQDIFDQAIDIGRFDTIAWNTPFIFMPDQFEDKVLMAFGGKMGMGITLRFVERLPALLTASGVAYIATAAPVDRDGTNYLLAELDRLRSLLGQDVTYFRGRSFRGHRDHREFHRQAGIARFEFALLEVRMGPSRLREVEPGFVDAAVEQVRRQLFKLGRG